MGVEEMSYSPAKPHSDGLHEEPQTVPASHLGSEKETGLSDESGTPDRPIGFKLYLILAAMTFTQFVIMLDISVIVTVRVNNPSSGLHHVELTAIIGHPSDN